MAGFKSGSEDVYEEARRHAVLGSKLKELMVLYPTSQELSLTNDETV